MFLYIYEYKGDLHGKKKQEASLSRQMQIKEEKMASNASCFIFVSILLPR